MMATLIQAATPYSCALACIESIFRDVGTDFSQQVMFEKLEGQFPEWEEHLGNTRIADLPRIFEAAGIPAEMLQPIDVPETVGLFAESLGAIVSREKWWKDESKSELIDNWHAMRLIEIRDTELVVMNPGYAPRQSRLESLPIRDLKAIGSRIFVFRRREENA